MVFITKKINKELWSVNPMSWETVSLAGRRFFFPTMPRKQMQLNES